MGLRTSGYGQPIGPIERLRGSVLVRPIRLAIDSYSFSIVNTIGWDSGLGQA